MKIKTVEISVSLNQLHSTYLHSMKKEKIEYDAIIMIPRFGSNDWIESVQPTSLNRTEGSACCRTRDEDPENTGG